MEETYNSRLNSQRKEEGKTWIGSSCPVKGSQKSFFFFSVMDRIVNTDVRVPLKKVQQGVGKMKSNMSYFQIIHKEKHKDCKEKYNNNRNTKKTSKESWQKQD